MRRLGASAGAEVPPVRLQEGWGVSTEAPGVSRASEERSGSRALPDGGGRWPRPKAGPDWVGV